MQLQKKKKTLVCLCIRDKKHTPVDERRRNRSKLPRRLPAGAVNKTCLQTNQAAAHVCILHLVNPHYLAVIRLSTKPVGTTRMPPNFMVHQASTEQQYKCEGSFKCVITRLQAEKENQTVGVTDPSTAAVQRKMRNI